MMPLGRRSLLRGLAGSALALSLGACSESGAPPATNTRYSGSIGAQLWSVFAALREDFDGTLRAVAQAGFTTVESAGFGDLTPEEFAKRLGAAGLTCDAAHIGMTQLAQDIPGAASQIRDAGSQLMVVASPMTPQPLVPGPNWLADLRAAMTLDAWRRNAELLNKAAEAAESAGLQLAYHNHAAEFALYDGQQGFEVLLGETDPAKVLIELDVAWALVGGQDPLALMSTLSSRIARLHLKDLASDYAAAIRSATPITAAVGQGVVDWPAILAAAEAIGAPGAYLEVEPDVPGSHPELLRQGREFLESVTLG